MESKFDSNFTAELQLNAIVVALMRTYFYHSSNNNKPCVLQISGDDRMSRGHADGFPQMIFSDSAPVAFSERERCQNILIDTRRPLATLRDFEEYIRKETQVRYNNRRYLIVNDVGHTAWARFSDHSLREADRVHVTCPDWLNAHTDVDGGKDSLAHIHDVLLMYYDSRNEECVFCTFVRHENNTIQWISLERWSVDGLDVRISSKNLYPNRLRDAELVKNGDFKRLRGGGTDYLPYSHIETKMGMELIALMEYARIYNFTLEIYKDDDYWGEIYENWTGPGVLGGVVSDKYDVGFSALFMLPSRIIYSDFTRPTAFSCVSCIVPAPRLVESWLTPVYGLTTYLWAGFFVSYATVVIIVVLLRRYMMNIDDNMKHIRILTVSSMFLVQSLILTQLPKHSSLRLIFVMVFMFCLLIATAYNSRFSSLLVVPNYEGFINDVDDLAASGIQWGEMAIDWVLPLEVDERPVFKVVYRNFRVADEDELRQISKHNKFAFGMERLITGYFAIGAYLKEDVVDKYQAMNEDLYRQYTNWQLRKNSILLPSMDAFLMRAWECGLLYYWEEQTNLFHMDMKVQQSLRSTVKSEGAVQLRMFHIKGLFLMLAIGLSISTITFLIEIYFIKFKMQRKSTDLL